MKSEEFFTLHSSFKTISYCLGNLLEFFFGEFEFIATEIYVGF